MGAGPIISNDRQAREATAAIDRLNTALSSERVLKSIVEGLPPEVIGGVRRSLLLERKQLAAALEAYNATKHGNFDLLVKSASGDPGVILIVARIANGLSQKDLARKLGLREQAIQRYESEKYRSISLANFQKFAGVLGVQLVPELSLECKSNWQFSYDVDKSVMRKVLKHARDRGWLERETSSDEDAIGMLIRYVGDHVVRHGTPSLQRTGLKVIDSTMDWSLVSWKAHVTRRAEDVITTTKPRFDIMDVSWLRELVKLSPEENGPLLAQEFLLKHGIVLIAEPQIPGMSLDGSAFLVDDIPVIGMTILRDTLDNFWFTLMHEIGHVVLHYRTGLSNGFFDNFEDRGSSDLEAEADRFASNMFVPDEIWERSPARIAKSPEALIELARQLEIHPAIVLGRVRMERQNYSLFSDRLGRGVAGKQLLAQQRGGHA